MNIVLKFDNFLSDCPYRLVVKRNDEYLLEVKIALSNENLHKVDIDLIIKQVKKITTLILDCNKLYPKMISYSSGPSNLTNAPVTSANVLKVFNSIKLSGKNIVLVYVL